MSVFPDDSKPVPEGTQTIGSLGELEKVTEESVKTLIKARHLPASQNVAGAFTTIVSGIGQALRDGIKGVVNSLSSLFRPVYDAGQEMRDGQVELNRRTDLLSPLLEYGSAYMGTLKGWDVTGAMPFRSQIGPMRGCRIDGDGIRLEKAGLWDIRAQITAESAIIVTGRMQWRVLVSDPQGWPFSEQVATVTSNAQLTQTIVSSVVVPGPWYHVTVEVTALGAGRTILGGPRWNRLVVQHISNEVAGNTGAEESQTPPGPAQGPVEPPGGRPDPYDGRGSELSS